MFCYKMRAQAIAFWSSLQMPCSICFVIFGWYMLTERSRSAQGCLLNFSSSMVCPWPAVFSGLCLATIQDPSGLQQDVYIPQERTTESKLADEFTERDGWFHVRTWNYFNHDGPCTTNHVEALGNRLLKKWHERHIPNSLHSWKWSRGSRLPLKSPTIEQLSGAWRADWTLIFVLRNIKLLVRHFGTLPFC